MPNVSACVVDCDFDGATSIVTVKLADSDGHRELLTSIPHAFKGVPAIVNGQVLDAIVAAYAARGIAINKNTDIGLWAGLV